MTLDLEMLHDLMLSQSAGSSSFNLQQIYKNVYLILAKFVYSYSCVYKWTATTKFKNGQHPKHKRQSQNSPQSDEIVCIKQTLASFALLCCCQRSKVCNFIDFFLYVGKMVFYRIGIAPFICWFAIYFD